MVRGFLSLFCFLVLAGAVPAFAGQGSGISGYFDWDTESPTVASAEPRAGAKDLPARLEIAVRFASPVELSSLSASSVQVRGSTSGEIGVELAYGDPILLVRPERAFQLGETVTARLTTAVKDAFGNPLDGNRNGRADGSPADDYSWSFTIGEHTPSLAIDRVERLSSSPGKVQISYTSEDPDGNFLTTAAWQFSRDGVNWLNINAAQIAGNDLLAPGAHTLAWDTQAGTNNLDRIEDSSVWFRMQVTDGVFSSSYAVSPVFEVDNNDLPETQEVTGPASEAKGDVRIQYRLSDREGDPLSLQVAYSTDNGVRWRPALVSGQTSGITTYSGALTWRSGQDLDGFDGMAQFRVIPADADTGTGSTSTPFHVDNNDLPRVQVADIFRTVIDTVSIAYTLEDTEKDTLSIFCEYSTDGGVSWKTATVAGDTSGLTVYSGSVLWRAVSDEPVISTLQGRFRITPRDKDQGSPGQTANFQWVRKDIEPPELLAIQATMGEPHLVVRFDEPLGESGLVAGNYTLSSGLGVARVTAAGEAEYRLDLATGQVQPSPELVLTLTVSGVSDAYGNTLAAPMELSFRPEDGNANPAVRLGKIEGKQGGRVAVPYIMSDAEGDTLALRVEYALEGGTWKEAGVSRNTGILAEQYTGTFIWDSEADMPHAEGGAQLRVTPFDRVYGTWREYGTPDSLSLVLDNNHPPSVQIDPLPDEQYGDVVIAFHLSDDEGDTLSLAAEWWNEQEAAWQTAAVEGVLKGIGPARYADSLVWHTTQEDVLKEAVGIIPFRIIPQDKDPGIPDTVAVRLNNAGAPSLVITSDFANEQKGEVEIDYRLSDDEGDLVSLSCFYSTDEGNTWQPASVVGDTSGIGPSGYVGTMVWQSGVDLAGVDDQVRFRLVPHDRLEGVAGESEDFLLDNNQAPTVELKPLPETHTDLVPLSCEVQDAEGDSVRLDAAYSLDQGRTWNPATLEENPAVTPGASRLVWKARQDLGSAVGQVQVRAVPWDLDEGVGDTVVVSLQMPVGDATQDGWVDGEDLPGFALAWNTQDLRFDMGPATGVPPALHPQPDGRVDFEDLAVFVLLWNWSADQRQAGAGRLAAGPWAEAPGLQWSDGELPFFPPGESVPLDLRLPEQAAVMGLHLDWSFDPTRLCWQGMEALAGLQEQAGHVLVLARVDEVEGRAVVDVARLGGQPPAVYGNQPLVRVFWSAREDLADEPLAVQCRAWDGQGSWQTPLQSTLKLRSGPPLPQTFALRPAAPNPFNPETAIQYEVPEVGPVRLEVYDVAGQRVRVLRDEVYAPGYYQVLWDGRDQEGEVLGSGVYFVVMRAATFRQVAKVALVR